MKASKVITLSLLLIAGLLTACAPSEEELNATATQVAESLFATQTAEAPTPTNTPTPTDTPTPTPIATPTATPTPTPTPPDPTALLQEALDAQLTSPHHLKSEAHLATSMEGLTTEISIVQEGDIQPPDSSQTSMLTEFLGESEEVETIKIGDEVYVRDSETGEWQFMKDPEQTPFISHGQSLTDLSDVANLTFVGSETLEGATVYHLQGDAPASAFGIDLDGEATFDYWVDLDRLPRKNTIEGELSVPGEMLGLPELGSLNMDWKQTIWWSDFGKKLIIEAPEVAPRPVFVSKLEEILADAFPPEAETYHVVPDGSGDFSDLSTAVATVGIGATLVLDPGVYYLDEPLDIDKSLRLMGAGSDQTEIASESAGYVLQYSGDGVIAAESLTFRHQGVAAADVVVVQSGVIAFADCVVIGGVPAGEGGIGVGLRLQGRSTGIIQECVATDNVVGIMAADTSQPALIGNLCEANIFAGILVTGGAQPSLERNICTNNQESGLVYLNEAGGVARDNEFTSNGIDGIQVWGNAQPTLENNILANNQESGISYLDEAGGVARDNECLSNDDGIQVWGNAEPTLEGNKCTNNQKSGIIYWNEAGGIARNNDCSSNDYYGIAVAEQAHPTLEENICANNGYYGIVFKDDARGVARDNECFGNEVGIIVVDNATPDLIDNNSHNNGEADIIDERP